MSKGLKQQKLRQPWRYEKFNLMTSHRSAQKSAEDDAVMADARRRKLNAIFACSIIGIGRSPADF